MSMFSDMMRDLLKERGMTIEEFAEQVAALGYEEDVRATKAVLAGKLAPCCATIPAAEDILGITESERHEIREAIRQDNAQKAARVRRNRREKGLI